MPIDGCQHTFQELASEILPADMARMREVMKSPFSMRSFCKGGVKSIMKQTGHAADFPGCYVLLEGGTPFYVGISRGVIGRLKQHVQGTTHFDASFAYRLACGVNPHSLRRGEAMLNDDFKKAFATCQERIKMMDVAFVEIRNDLELYLFEVYCALELRTVEHNSFRTH